MFCQTTKLVDLYIILTKYFFLIAILVNIEFKGVNFIKLRILEYRIFAS